MENRRVKWGVLGTAGIAWEQTIPGMKQAYNCELYAIAGRSTEKVKQFQDEFGFEKAYNSYDVLLDDEQVEAVYIPLPNQLHKEWAVKAARKKKHILCEKPLAPTAAEVKELVQVCEQEGVLLMEAFAYLHSDATKEILDKVHDNVIGKPQFMESCFFTPSYEQENIRMRRETFGGGTYDLGCYNISLILSVFQEMPCQVRAMGGFMENGVDDFSAAYMVFPSGARASAEQGLCSPQRADRYYIYGTEGTLEAPIRFNQEGAFTYLIHKNGKTETFTSSVKSNYQLETEQFGRCILEGEKPWVSNEFSVEVAEVMDQVLKEIGY
ncbi:MAG: Gfo/Idh/MocA family oxidoreductase [Faecalicatena sp.]|uniref:Gfo/Idh/MocA family protein n=1 Tax=Faecalicatena sp. TaxID=2005360 RepID=UPI00258AE185|nr:Gfo/Idh/MocA family oxidoreductase [Faecalicatena sp.]MCI6465320.1 Gfo/Idh/MocA family oxidoreductase [Faecalicatena sp.]MDY5617518.1 Gfo/Idh/MocA family oxidoreductase [Lachnospiraceae bacterium]